MSGPKDNHRKCSICFDPLNFLAVFECNHNEICALCAFRLRDIDNDHSCVICKQISSKVFVIDFNSLSGSHDVKFEDFNGPKSWHDVNRMKAESKYIEHISSKLLFEKKNTTLKEMERLNALKKFNCGIEGCPKKKFNFRTFEELNRHLYRVHQLSICSICVDSGKQFIGEIKRRNKSEMKIHLERGNPKTEGFSGHPKCEFCSKNKLDLKRHHPVRFYDNDALYKHLNKDHEICHVCKKQGKLYEYFRDRPSLFQHFKEKHFVCEENECKDLFVVFGDFYELKAHIVSNHPHIQMDRRIMTNFRIKRDTVNQKQSSAESPAQITFDYEPEHFPSVSQNEHGDPTPAPLSSGEPLSVTEQNENFGNWAILAGNTESRKFLSNFSNEEQFPSLSKKKTQAGHQTNRDWAQDNSGNESIKNILGPYAKDRLKKPLKVKSKLPFSSYNQAVEGVHNLDLETSNRREWEKERKNRANSDVPNKSALKQSWKNVSNTPNETMKQKQTIHFPVNTNSMGDIKIPQSLRNILHNNTNLIHNIKTSAMEFSADKQSVTQFYRSIWGGYRSTDGKTSFSSFFKSVLAMIKSPTKKEELNMHHHQLTSTRFPKKKDESNDRLSYLNSTQTVRNFAKKRVNDTEYPALGKSVSETPVNNGTWNLPRKNGKFDIDEWLRQNPPKKNKEVSNHKKSRKKKGVSKQLTDLFS